MFYKNFPPAYRMEMSCLSNDIFSLYEFKDVCRICFEEHENLKSIFETNCAMQLEYCEFLKVDKNDILPKTICTKCEIRINRSYALKKRCLYSKEILEKLLNGETKLFPGDVPKFLKPKQNQGTPFELVPATNKTGYPCEICKYVCYSLNEFNAHTKVHLASTPPSKSTDDQDKKVTSYESKPDSSKRSNDDPKSIDQNSSKMTVKKKINYVDIPLAPVILNTFNPANAVPSIETSNLLSVNTNVNGSEESRVGEIRKNKSSNLLRDSTLNMNHSQMETSYNTESVELENKHNMNDTDETPAINYCEAVFTENLHVLDPITINNNTNSLNYSDADHTSCENNLSPNKNGSILHHLKEIIRHQNELVSNKVFPTNILSQPTSNTMERTALLNQMDSSMNTSNLIPPNDSVTDFKSNASDDSNKTMDEPIPMVLTNLTIVDTTTGNTSVNGPIPKLISCTQCGEEFEDEHDLTLHKNIHSQGALSCPKCPKVFMSRLLMQRHMQTHMTTKKHFCKQSGKGFSHEHNLSLHMKKHEKIVHNLKYVCDICGQRYAEESFLTIHKKKHDREKSLRCAVCSKTFSDLNSLKLHELTHTTDKQHKCPQCSKTFVQTINLQKHLKVHKYKRLFNDNNVHMEDENEVHECEFCSKTFKSKYTLNNHKRTCEDNPFMCVICKKTFALKRHLLIHINGTHVKKGILQCGVCGKEFPTTPVLQQHIKTHYAARGAASQKKINDENKDIKSSTLVSNNSTNVIHHCPKCDKIFESSCYLQHECLSDQ